MCAAHSITKAERSIALDADMNVQAQINIEDGLLQSAAFKKMLENTIAEAIEAGSAVISNNLIQNDDDAPNTNIHLHDLRMIVAIPLGDYGALYLDQHIRNGVFEREVIDKLTALGSNVIENEQTDLSDKGLITLFNEM
jgi:adenine-specific DNA methylase